MTASLPGSHEEASVSLQELEAAVAVLPPPELVEFTRWFEDYLAGLTDAQRTELERRADDDDANPDAGVRWEQVKAEALARWDR